MGNELHSHRRTSSPDERYSLSCLALHLATVDAKRKRNKTWHKTRWASHIGALVSYPVSQCSHDADCPSGGKGFDG